MFLLVNPSTSVEEKIRQFFDLGRVYPYAVSPCSIQSLLVADSLKGWMKYMVWLEGELNDQVR
jgi:hypothetical protein